MQGMHCFLGLEIFRNLVFFFSSCAGMGVGRGGAGQTAAEVTAMSLGVALMYGIAMYE
jgi:hypothetical protein